RPLSDRWVANLHNMSIQGIVLRGFWPGCGAAGPTLPAATAIALAISLLLVGAAWWIARPALRDRIDLPYALFALLSTFINAWSWEHYNVFLILPFLLVVVALWRGAHRGMPLGFVVIAVAALLFV